MTRYVFLAALACGALASDAPPPEPSPSPSPYAPEVQACRSACEKAEPEDRGQGCIDQKCNPLFTEE